MILLAMRQSALAVGLTALLLASPVAGAATSLCEGAERVIFACRVGAKLVSLCEAPTTGEGVGLLQYRIGRPGRMLEMRYPEATDSDPDFRAGRTTLAGGGGALQALHDTGLDGQRMLRRTRQFVRCGGPLGLTAEVQCPGQAQRRQVPAVTFAEAAQVV